MAVRRIGTIALAAMLALGGLAACGDDGGDDDNVALEESDGNDSGTGDDNADDNSDDDTSDTTIDLGPGFENTEECLEIATAYGSLSLIFLGGALGEGEDLDLDEVLGRIEAVRDEAPDEVADAFDVVIDTYREVAENLGDDLSAVDFLDPDTIEALEPLNDSDFNEANDTVSAYLDEQCTPNN